MANILEKSGQTLITYRDVAESHPEWSDVAVQDYIAQKQDLLEAVNQNASDLLDRTIWQGYWSEGTYNRSDQVHDNGWLMIANKETTDRAAPQTVGPNDYLLSQTQPFVQQSDNSVVITGHQYTFTTAGALTAARVWVPALSADITYRFVIADITDPNNPVAKSTLDPFLNANEWTVLTVDNLFVTPGSIILMYIEAINSSSTSSFSFDWTYGGVSNNTGPADGGWNRNQQNTTLRISVLDELLVDRSANLALITAGSDVIFTDNVPPAGFYNYHVNSNPVLDVSGDFYTWDATLDDTTDNILVGSSTLMAATVPVPSATQYEEDAAFFPAGEPDYADIIGVKQFGGVDQAGDLNAYGVDIKFQNYLVSPDWDYQSFTEIAKTTPPSAGPAHSVTSASATYQALMSDDGVLCTGTFTVTLPDYAYAIRPVTIASIAGTITVAGDVTIETPVTVTTGTSATWFPAGGQWWLR